MHSDDTKYNFECGRNINILNVFDDDHRVLNGLYRVLDNGCHVLKNVYRVLNNVYDVLNNGCHVLINVYRVLNNVYDVLINGYHVLNNVYYVLIDGCHVLINGYRVTDIGYYVLYFETFSKLYHQIGNEILNNFRIRLKPKYSINLVFI
jgi:hypothetical protein